MSIHYSKAFRNRPDVGPPVPIKESHVQVITDKENENQPEDFKADFRWRCPCPGCTTTVLAFKDEGATLEEVCADGRCCYCRKGRAS